MFWASQPDERVQGKSLGRSEIENGEEWPGENLETTASIHGSHFWK